MVFLFYRSELFWPLLIGDLLKKALWRLCLILLINQNHSGI